MITIVAEKGCSQNPGVSFSNFQMYRKFIRNWSTDARWGGRRTTSWTSWMLTNTFWFLEAMAVEPSRSVMTKHSCRRVRISSAFCSVGSLQRPRVGVVLEACAILGCSWLQQSACVAVGHRVPWLELGADWAKKQTRNPSMCTSSCL